MLPQVTNTEYTATHSYHINSPENGITLAAPPSLLGHIGRSAGTIISQLAYMINRTSRFIDGKYWYTISYKDMQAKWFPFLGERTILNHVQVMVKDLGLLETKNLHKENWNHTNSYTLTQAGMELLAAHGIKLRLEFWEQLPADMQTPESLMDDYHDIFILNGDTEKISVSDMKKIPNRKRKNFSTDTEKSSASHLENNSLESPTEEIGEDSQGAALKKRLLFALQDVCDPATGRTKRDQALDSLAALNAQPEEIYIVLEYLKETQHYAKKGRRPHYSQVLDAYAAAMEWASEQETKNAEWHAHLRKLTDGDYEPQLTPKVAEVLDNIRAFMLKYPRHGKNGVWNLENMPGYTNLFTQHAIMFLVTDGYLAAGKERNHYALTNKL